ncbi:hypothetical protein FHX81_6321 [Saccharothrix saharensis]|uniref:Uncharacterized protein n=1 Tax=Saccharothrix saharensis TaxID=571190 RepID=A0A543JLZ4_9PSEU|nr:hypothetical protein [Saccharothrix saharensis]TQM83887.1 hypothetical protein FHX81_6321 [Saccharothrix saharensis]
MSFSWYARRAGDATVPLPHRVSSFRSCVRRFHAAPYAVSMRYLELEAGPFERDERALAAALELLLALRAEWKADLAAYAATRRAEKRRGLRTPRGATPFDRDHPRPPLPVLRLSVELRGPERSTLGS